MLLASCKATHKGGTQSRFGHSTSAAHPKTKKGTHGSLHLASGVKKNSARHKSPGSRASAQSGIHRSESFKRNILEVNLLPAESLRIGYNLAINRFLSLGCDVSMLYPHLLLLNSEKTFNSALAYPDNYFELNQPYYEISPYLKLYLWHDPKEPLAGVYLKGVYNTTTLIDGLKSIYMDKAGIPIDSTGPAYLKMYPGGKILEQNSSFKTWGYDLVFGGTTPAFGKHWVFDFGVGYQYLHLPADITTNRTAGGTTYYYHDTPMWRNPINFNLLMQISFGFKF